MGTVLDFYSRHNHLENALRCNQLIIKHLRVMWGKAAEKNVPSRGWKKFCGHGAHGASPVSEYVPGSHLALHWLTLCAPGWRVKVPSGQVVHCLNPSTGGGPEKESWGHSRQGTRPEGP